MALNAQACLCSLKEKAQREEAVVMSVLFRACTERPKCTSPAVPPPPLYGLRASWLGGT